MNTYTLTTDQIASLVSAGHSGWSLRVVQSQAEDGTIIATMERPFDAVTGQGFADATVAFAVNGQIVRQAS